MVAAVAARAGLRDSAQSILRSASSDEMLLPAAYVEVLLGDEDAALTLLEKQARRVGPGELAWHPWFASLRTRPRFQAIVTSHPSTSPAR
jgi:hypothetical protein